MGLDMYLEGHKHRIHDFDNPEKNTKEDGFPLIEKVLRLGYWRKHHALHDYIVEAFAKGVDDCQDIHLSEEQLSTLLKALQTDELSRSSKFDYPAPGEEFYEETKEEDLRLVGGALTWLRDRKTEQDVWRSVIYRASW